MGAKGRIAEDLSALRRRDRWWISLATIPALALFAWRVRDPASPPLESAHSVQGAAWVAGAVGYAGFASLSVVLCLIDVRTLRLPNRLLGVAAIWASAWLASAALLAGDWPRIGWALVVAAFGLAFFSLLWLRWRHSFGGGDVKLAPTCMFAVGWVDPLAALLVFPLAVAVATIPGIVVSMRNREATLPFGPSLIVAAWLTLALPSSWVLDWLR